MDRTATRTGSHPPTAFRHPAEPAALARVRHEVREVLRGGVPPETLGQVVLLVSELTTNAVRHTDSPWFSVELDRRDDVLHVEVRDGGRGPDGAAGERDPDRAGGWGLQLVERIADDWGLEVAGGTRAWFDVRL
jgi:anti-sigma regulatory factor (Ser/Thr protein kinase)